MSNQGRQIPSASWRTASCDVMIDFCASLILLLFPQSVKREIKCNTAEQSILLVDLMIGNCIKRKCSVVLGSYRELFYVSSMFSVIVSQYPLLSPSTLPFHHYNPTVVTINIIFIELHCLWFLIQWCSFLNFNMHAELKPMSSMNGYPAGTINLLQCVVPFNATLFCLYLWSNNFPDINFNLNHSNCLGCSS